MPYSSIVISSGHGKLVRGASGVLDEVNEARRVVDKVAAGLQARGVTVKTFHDDTSTSQNQNLNTIVNYHNKQSRQLDVSVHFNAYQTTSKPMGTEVLFVTQQALAAEMSAAIASAGFINRGPKKRTDLFFLNSTAMPAILLEVCFVDSSADAAIYNSNFVTICDDIATVLGGLGDELPPDGIEPPPIEVSALFKATGKMSHFGGPDDTGVSPSEGLAFHYSLTEDNQYLFLPLQPAGTTGLARRLNTFVPYVACRWDYSKTPKTMLAESGQRARVTSVATGQSALAFPADWGPNENTGRVADLSPGLCEILGVETDDEVEVIYPYGG